MVTEQEMIEFENEIGELFNNKQIKAPIHLYHSNEKQMLKIFENIAEVPCFLTDKLI